MMIALLDIWRSRLRFGLLAAAVGLLFFLLLFVNTLSGALLGQFVGAITGNNADVFVYDAEAQATIPASRLAPGAVEQVARVEGVAAASPISVLNIDLEADGDSLDSVLWGIEPGEPGTPATIVDGRLPSEGEALVDTTARDAGLTLGAIMSIDDLELAVVGVAENATFSVLPTLYVDRATFGEVFAAQFPQAPAPDTVNLVGVQVEEGVLPADVIAAISAFDGLEALDRQAAADATPGVSSIGQSFGLITGITFLIVVVVVGFFFQILTVQKLRSFTVLKALGAGSGSLARTVLTQIAVLVGLGIVAGSLFLVGAVAGFNSGLAIRADPVLIAGFGGAVMASSLLAGLTSLRRIARQDAATAAFEGGR